jgi:hypothetical protein
LYKGQRITVIIPCSMKNGGEQVLRRMPESSMKSSWWTMAQPTVPRKSPDLWRSVIREDVRGYGRSYKTGFRRATGDGVTLDGDPAITRRHLLPDRGLPSPRSGFLTPPDSRCTKCDEFQTQIRQLGVIAGDVDPLISDGFAIRSQGCGSSEGVSGRHGAALQQVAFSEIKIERCGTGESGLRKSPFSSSRLGRLS